ncbi:hypothetical protein SAMN04490186_2164 [Pseudomonas grimontii]|uniref:Uncharacterized protein n=1 Tax=Pseudomonas grimontii TaxID=129847 RepID=A0A1H1E6I6_9PSED|nr:MULTISPECIES: hypothetical protein [Pseudomonas]MDB1110794.1 hypothetical protein [Pseudomonas extremaustralis]TWR54766.1 hypothetical protein FIV39_30570 [Pseudomonas grimontii]WLI01028.1 hypothetical protein PSH95_27390 [Pseudomonas simiae]SDQ84108.1 hypothetical protein SAMN04490186_2164 [Pseudomonas grimontii]
MLPSNCSAEDRFRAAFERLKIGASSIVPSGTPITQNNVAREAGLDPSALKKSRFPILINEIKNWIASFSVDTPPSKHKQLVGQRDKNRTLRTQIKEIKTQRDYLQSLLLEADAKIMELSTELVEIKKLVESQK